MQKVGHRTGSSPGIQHGNSWPVREHALQIGDVSILHLRREGVHPPAGLQFSQRGAMALS
jgi:hypothetical protein